jgi:hypothetical protein
MNETFGFEIDICVTSGAEVLVSAGSISMISMGPAGTNVLV